MPNPWAGQRDVFAKVVEDGSSMKVKRGIGMQLTTYWDVVDLDSPEGKTRLREWSEGRDGEQRYGVR